MKVGKVLSSARVARLLVTILINLDLLYAIALHFNNVIYTHACTFNFVVVQMCHRNIFQTRPKYTLYKC